MRILFLDDERAPDTVKWVKYPQNAIFTIVRTAREFLAAVEDNPAFYAWSLDHDLGEDEYGELEPTGYDALQLALLSFEQKAPETVCVHSKNPIGASKMVSYWNNWKVNH